MYFLVKSDHLVLVVDNSADEINSVALEEKCLNLFPAAEELQLLFKGLEANVRVKVFALLEDSNGQRSFDLLLVLRERRICSECVRDRLGSILAHLKWRLLLLDEFKESLHFRATLNDVGVLRADLGNK